jgi:hypothetical protein
MSEPVDIQPTNDKKITFTNIHIRIYKQVLGDHPECIHGPPVSLGWNYIEAGTWSVDDYEEARGTYRPNAKILHMSELRRESILKDNVGASDQEIKDAIYAVKQIQRQREETVDRDFPLKDKRSLGEKFQIAMSLVRRPSSYF